MSKQKKVDTVVMASHGEKGGSNDSSVPLGIFPALAIDAIRRGSRCAAHLRIKRN